MAFSAVARTKTKIQQTKIKAKSTEESATTEASTSIFNNSIGNRLGSNSNAVASTSNSNSKKQQKQQSNSNQQEQQSISSNTNDSQSQRRQSQLYPINSSSESDFGKESDDLDKKIKKEKGKGKQKEVKKKKTKKRPRDVKVESDDDEEEKDDSQASRIAILAANKRRKSSDGNNKEKKPKRMMYGQVRAGSSESEDNDPMTQTIMDMLNDPSNFGETSKSSKSSKSNTKSKNKKLKKGGETSSSSSSSSSEEDSDEEAKKEEEIKRKHLKGSWRRRDAPEVMSASRRKLELKYNPLIELLRIKIPVNRALNSEDSDDKSDDAKLDSSDEDRKPVTLGRSKFALDPDGHPSDNSTEYSTADESDSNAEKEPIVPVRKSMMLDIDYADDAVEESTQDESAEEDEVKVVAPTSPVTTVVPYVIPPIAMEVDDSPEEQSTQDESETDNEVDTTPFSSSSPIKLPAAQQIPVLSSQEREELAREADIRERQKKADEEQAAKLALERAILSEQAPLPLSIYEEEELEKKRYHFKPFVQRKGKPKFEIKDYDTSQSGTLDLGKDDDGSDLIVPACINRFLRPYQREGVKFLVGQYLKGLGGILGDDMGLGKTIQVIATLSAIMKKTGSRSDLSHREDAISSISKKRMAKYGFPPASYHGATCLIICPASVVHNWEREFETWGYFNVGIYEGSASDKKDVLDRFERGYTDVVLAGYEGVRANIDTLIKYDFTMIIADEAHRIKNPKSMTTKALHQFDTVYRYGLTGTAVQNRLSEFHCCLDWAQPGAVGTPEQWKIYITKPIQEAQKSNAEDEQIILGRERAQAVVKYLHPTIFLRRTKESVHLQLPQKTDMIVLCPLTPLQKAVYKRMISSDDVQVMLTIDEPCECGATDQDQNPVRKGDCCHRGWSKMIFTYITLFQKISNHLALIYPDKEDTVRNKDKYEKDLDWAQIAFPDDFHLRTKGRVFGTETTLCGKWQILTQLLDVWKEDSEAKNKVLIFSMSLKVLGHIKELMEFSAKGYKYLCLDGTVPPSARMALVDDFNNDPDVFCFLVSTKAGGVGLNLTAANKVVIFDPNWNPAHDLQAMDRAYRFGQTRNVDVYRLIGAGTLEELIYNRQQYKRAQANIVYDAAPESRTYDGIQDDPDNKGSLWGIKNMFTLHDGFSLTKSKIQEVQFAELEYSLKNAIIDEDAKKKKKKNGKSSDSDSDREVASDDEDQIRENLEALGLNDDSKDVKKPDIDPKRKLEQDRIIAILNSSDVAYTAISDNTLGGSKIEGDRLKAVQGRAQQAKLGALPDKKSRKPIKKRPPVTSSTFNALSRKKHTPSSTTAINSSPSTSSPPPIRQEDIQINLRQILEASGYQGSTGLARWHEEMMQLNDSARLQKTKNLQKTYKRSLEKGKGREMDIDS